MKEIVFPKYREMTNQQMEEAKKVALQYMENGVNAQYVFWETMKKLGRLEEARECLDNVYRALAVYHESGFPGGHAQIDLMQDFRAAYAITLFTDVKKWVGVKKGTDPFTPARKLWDWGIYPVAYGFGLQLYRAITPIKGFYHKT